MCACHTQDLQAQCRTTSSVRRSQGRANVQSARELETASASPSRRQAQSLCHRRLQAKLSADDKLILQTLSVSKYIGRDFSPMRVASQRSRPADVCLGSRSALKQQRVARPLMPRALIWNCHWCTAEPPCLIKTLIDAISALDSVISLQDF
jgi:hypothetical protein